MFETVVKKGQGRKKTFFMATKVVPIVILCRMHRLSNSGDLFVDDFVDISIFMIWGSWGEPDQDWLDWQIWPSGWELGKQPQAPGSIPPAPLVGSNLCASRQRTLRK